MIGKVIVALAAAGGGLYLWHRHQAQAAHAYGSPAPVSVGTFDRLVPGDTYQVLAGPLVSLSMLPAGTIPAAYVTDLAQQGFVVQQTAPAPAPAGEGDYVLTGAFKGGQSAFKSTLTTRVLGVKHVNVNASHNPVFP
jgi:hypothetical protein